MRGGNKLNFTRIKMILETQKHIILKMQHSQHTKKPARFNLNKSFRTLSIKTKNHCEICARTTAENPQSSKQQHPTVCSNCKNTYESKIQSFYGYLFDQKSLHSENLEFAEHLVLQISTNFFLCQSKCINHLFREVPVIAQTDKYIICDGESCSNCKRIKSMILIRKVPAINDLLKTSNLKEFYLKWVSVFGIFLERLAKGSIRESELEMVECYKNTGNRRIMMQPCSRTNSSGGFSAAVYSASTMKQEMHMFITKYRLDRSMQVFSKALEQCCETALRGLKIPALRRSKILQYGPKLFSTEKYW